MNKFLFFGVSLFTIISTISCKKESFKQPIVDTQVQKKSTDARKCPEGSVLFELGVDPNTGNIGGAIEMSWSNEFNTFKAIDVSIYRIETGGNLVLFMHQILGRPGTGILSADYIILPSSTIGLIYVINCYKTDMVKGNPCSTTSGSKYF
ncbi:MAG: hypothetical protein V4556_08600 [Bacteroidota bacterium]